MSDFLLVSERGYEQSQLWITLAYIGWFTSFLIGILYYSRKGKQLDEIVAGEGIESDAFLANYNAVANVNTFELGILLLVVIDMAVKPGL